MRIKICGITRLDQGQAIASLGATALGFICVRASPRYIHPDQIRAITSDLPDRVDRIGVFANATFEEIWETFHQAKLTGVQLHGDESPLFCDRLRQELPHGELIKAIRVKTPQSLTLANSFIPHVDALLLDAYHGQQLGGTGLTIDWQSLGEFRPAIPWFLAGGLNPDNIIEALSCLNPDGIDLSSGVERSPGDKDIAKVTQLFEKLNLTKSPFHPSENLL
ncbi:MULTISPECIES: phosphoribosylanthranilate isomerase [Arthrospira]|jgi:phosphoribosylanthranilate isomerase|uniref:N-(5'-phosphoribosyl)anthranilate isomerase n=1 Tax=Limnospira platensis NIES-46 TaxID=1236695 RepID=A0A5M3T826_LIMPL|nr:phosphoribosylanthranilate isomerase [Arthrospira platensis]AMW28541.1 N-(5'-phosphoribosyl)anthranilate isomerase [Arthrospira platensis YZ]KDR55629.1 N-(5'-phosphoribosyl)anthranilate isomerase [Arthrospira platensis str. Paraca]MBD2670514.1 phosphoribosylanthranilate isomerase [Arthrospira platensis FACHB-439]MBD2711173.1 phosphoribosylanthranilate isomerase [Arthrospira platensis FACHB-835]MDF2209769.1 phosphoribosylanthranilate isomerase [Arthrospira platensis NCB002]MDT9184523.1 phos